MFDLSVSENESHVEVTWEAPFSLDVTGVEYDITYSLLIYNITDWTQLPTLMACAVCHNLTLTHFTFSPPHPLPGHSFTFTVTPQNGAGSGPPSDPITATLTSVPSTPDTGAMPGGEDEELSPGGAVYNDKQVAFSLLSLSLPPSLPLSESALSLPYTLKA